MEMRIEPLSELFDKSMYLRFEWKDLGIRPVRFEFEIVREVSLCMFPRMT